MKLRLPHKFQAALMAALASVSFTTLSTGAAYAEESPLTFGADLGDVMYVGDSITHGIDAASWRWSMHKILVDAGVSYDENGYTSGNSTGGVTAGTTYGGVAFENVHSAHSGGDAYEVIGRAKRSGGHYGNTNIYNWLGIDTDLTVRNGTPDTYTYPVTDHVDKFLMLIGTNDLLSSHQDQAATIAGSASDDLVTDIGNIYGVMRQANPGSQLVLLSIPCWTDHDNNNSVEVHQAVVTANEKLKTWAESQSGVLYADVNEGLVDVSSDVPFKGPRAFFRNPTSDGLHPNAQGELIIAGNVAQAMGYAGRSVGLERSSAAEPGSATWTPVITQQATITAGAAAQTVASGVFTSNDGYTVDFNAVYGNGGANGTWDNANAFSITVGDGTHSGTLSLTEAYVKWGDKLLYSKDNSQAGDNLRIAYVNASAYSADNVSAGYYVWLGDKLIGEALTAGSASAGFNGVSLQATGADATVTTLSWTNHAYAPTTEGYVNDSAAFHLVQTVPMPGHDANPAHITDFNDKTARKETSKTIGSGFFGAVSSGTATSDTQVVYTLESQTGANAFGAVNASSNANIAAVFGGGGTVASGSYSSAESAAFMGAYSGSIAGKLSVEMNDITFAGNVIMGLVTNGTTRTVGSTELIVNAGARIQGNVYGGHGVKAQGTITGGTRIEVTGGTITGSIYGGNEAGSGGSVAGGSEILISGGVISGGVFGGSAGGTFSGATSVTVDGNLASIGGNIEADTVTLKNVASNTQGYTDGFDYYQGTIRAPRVELVDFTVERFMANIETQSLVLSGGSNTTLTNLTLTACDIDAQGASTVTLDGTLTLGNTTTYSGSVALADGLTVTMTGGEAQYTGEYSEGTSGYKMGSRDVMKLAEAAAEGSTLDVNTEALVGAGALAGNTFSYNAATGTLTATGADLTTFYVNAGDSLQYSSPVEENPVYGATGIAMNGGSLEFVEALKNGVTLDVTADGSRIIVNDGVNMAVKEITLSTLGSHALTLSGTMTASTAAEITANLIGGNANITTTGNISLSNGATSHAGGVLTVGAGLNFSLNSGRDHSYNISSFKQIVLESGSAINYHGGTGTFNNVTLAEGDASISITDMANSSMLTLAGETQLNGHKLSFSVPNSSWKRFVTIEKLVGDAASTLYFEGGKTSDGSGSHLTINSLQGFSGTLELKENNSGNPLIATVYTGSGSAVNLKALNLTGTGEEVTLSGNAPLSIGSLAMSQASSLTAGSLTVGALSGAGSLNITGDLAINGQSGDSTHSGNVKVLGEVTKSGAGSQTLGGGTLAFLGKITVEGGTLNIGTAGSTATYAGTISNSGVLGLNGTIALNSANLSAFTQVEDSATTTTYSGTGDFEGSGYMQSSAEYYLVRGSGTVSGTYDIDKTTGLLVTGKTTGGNVVVTFKSSDNTGLYYVNKTLNYDADTMGTASGFVIAAGATLTSDGSSYSPNKELHGEGTYALANNAKALNSGLSLGTDWTGAVRISGYSFANDMNALNSLANSNSWVELVGVHGWSNSVAINANLILGADSNGWSYYQDNGNDNQVLTFNGVVKGTGKFGRSNTVGQNQIHVFTNDISGWTGTYEARSADDRSTTLRLTNNAHEVNATISKMSGVFNVDVQTDVAFSKAITANTFTINQGRTATLTSTASLNANLAGAGTLNLDNANLTLDNANKYSGFTGTIVSNGASAKLVFNAAESFGGNLAQDNGGVIEMYGTAARVADSAARIVVTKKDSERLTLAVGSNLAISKVTVGTNSTKYVLVNNILENEQGLYTDIDIQATGTSENGIVLTTPNATSHIGSLSSASANTEVHGNYGATNTRTLAVHQNGDTIFAGKFANDGNRSVGLTKYGTGTLTLTGANASTQALTVNEGTVAFSGNGTWASDVTVNTGGTLDVQDGSAFTVKGSKTLTIDGGALTAAGTLKIGQAGNSAGALTMNSGSLTAAAIQTQYGGKSIEFKGGTVEFTPATAGDNAITKGSAGNGDRVAFIGTETDNLVLKAATDWKVDRTAYTTDANGLELGNFVVDAGNEGTVTFTNANSYGAESTITNNAKLILNTFTIDANEAVEVVANGSLTQINGVTGTGSFTKSGTGVLELTGTSTFNGGVSVLAGELKVSGAMTAAAFSDSADAITTINSDSTITAQNVTSLGTVAVNNAKLTMGPQNENAGTYSFNEVRLNNGDLYNNVGGDNPVRSIGSLYVDGANAKLTQRTWNTLWDVEHLNDGDVSGDRTLTWVVNTNHNKASVLKLTGEGDFSGTLVADRTSGGTSNGAYQAFVQIDDENALQNATLELKGGDANRRVSLALHTDNANISALQGGQYNVIYAGTALTSVSGSTPMPTSAGTATLTVTGDDNLTYAGVIRSGVTLDVANGAAQTIASSVEGNLAAHGALTFTTAVDTVGGIHMYNGGQLNLAEIGDSAITVNTLSLDSGSILNLGSLELPSEETDFIHLAKVTTLHAQDLAAITVKHDTASISDYKLVLDGEGYLSLTSAVSHDLIWDGGTATWDVKTTANWHVDGADPHSSTFRQMDNVTFGAGAASTATLGENITAGTMTLANGGATLTIATAGHNLTVNNLVSPDAATDNNLTRGAGAGTVTFNGEGTAYFGLLKIDASAGETVFNQHVVVTGNYGNKNYFDVNSNLTFNNGYEMTGTTSNNYALLIKNNATVTLGGTSDMPGKNIGVTTNTGKVVVLDGAVVTVNKFLNSSSGSNGILEVQKGGTINLNQLYATTLNLGGEVNVSGTAGDSKIPTINATGGTATFSSNTLNIGTAITASGGVVSTIDNANATTTTVGNITVSGANSGIHFTGFLTSNGGNYVNVGYSDTPQYQTAVFDKGFNYTGGNTYALLVGNANTVTLGGDSDWGSKTVGMAGTGKIILLDNATATMGRMYNSKNNSNNGTLELGNGSVFSITGTSADNRITGITNNGGTLNFANNLLVDGTVTGNGTIAFTGMAAKTLTFNDLANVTNYTGTVKNESAADLTVSLGTAANQLHMDITPTNTGKVNLALGGADYFLYGTQNVNNITHTTSKHMEVKGDGNVTATGKVVTGNFDVGTTADETGAVFTLSGEDAMLVTSGDEHSYGANVRGYGTFRVVNGATQILPNTGSFHGTFAADGDGSILTLTGSFASDVKLQATNGGVIKLTQSYTMGDNVAVEGGTLNVENGLVVNGLADLSAGTLNQTGGTVTVNADKSLTLGNASITSAIANSGTVNFTKDITATSLAKEGDDVSYQVGADDNRATNGNYFFQGQRTESTLRVVTGGTVNPAGHTVTQDNVAYVLKADGTATGVTGEANYSVFYQGEAGTTVSVSQLAATAAKHGTELAAVLSIGAWQNPTVLDIDRNLGTAQVGFGTVNIGSGFDYTGDLLIYGGMNTVNGQLDIAQVGFFAAQDSVTVFTDAPVEDGGVRFTSDAVLGGVQVQASKVSDSDDNYYGYVIGDSHYAVLASELSKEGGEDATVRNSLMVNRVHNSAENASGKLTLDSGVVAASLKEVTATSGDIQFMNMAAANATPADSQTQVGLDNLYIGSSKTVSFYENGIVDAAKEAKVTVNTTLTASVGAQLNADLEMASGSHLDVSGAQSTMGLLMGSEVTLNSNSYLDIADVGQDEVSGYLYNYLASGEHELYYLFKGTENDPLSLKIDGTQVEQLTFTDWTKFDKDASEVYKNLQAQTFYMVYDPNHNNVGMVAIGLVPEPTTSTLSLLALAALAARRRRK